jgi:serine/threonine protein kinase/tetratricopeptide (TPR) repeat protein
MSSPEEHRPMDDPSTLPDLLGRWQQLQERGQTVTLAELCADYPDKLPEIRQQLEAVASMMSFLDMTKDEDSRRNPPAADSTSGTGEEPATGGRSGPPPAPASVPGYELLGVLGRGGMGVVYKARQTNLDRLVALKMILAGPHASPTSLARFKVEAEAVARVEHPNIVKIHEIGEHEGLPYFSLEYVDGGSLAEQLKGTPQHPEDAARLIEKLAHAIHAAHQAGIIHRDLKPGNVLLRRKFEIRNSKSEPTASDFEFRISDFDPKVTDFGLAKHVAGEPGSKAPGAALTQTGAVLGTPSYMAPEQADGAKPVGPPADIYALGAILYEMLTGRPPFRAPTALDTILQVLSEEPVPPSRLQPKVPRDLETICLKCLQKEPAKRYGSALDLAADLGRFLNGEPILARPVGRVERTWRWCRRNPVVAGLSAALVLVVLGSLAGLTALWLQAESRRSEAEEQRQLAKEKEGEAIAQKAAVERQKRIAEDKTRLAQAEALRATREAAKANRITQVLTGMFEASDPLGLNGAPLLAVKTGETLTARQILDRGAARLATDLKEEPEVRARLLDTLGGVYCTLGETEKARPLLEEGLALRRRLLPPDHPELASSLHNLGWMYHQRGDYARAEKYYRQALQIRRRHADAEPLTLSTTLVTLAWLLADEEDFASSEKLFQEAIELRRRHLGDNHRDVAIARAGLAAVYLNEGKPLAAVQPSLQAFAVLQKLEGNKGLTEAVGLFQKGLLARDLPPLAARALGLGGPGAAEDYLRRALARTCKVLNKKHPYTGLVLHELAVTLEQAGKYEEAERDYRACLDIVRQFGLAHPKAHIAAHNFADLLRRRGKRAEAEELMREVVEASQKRYGAAHPLVADALLDFADLLDQPAQREHRERVLREALGIYRKVAGRPRRNQTHCLNRLAVCLGTSRAAEAEKLEEEALPLARKQLGGRDPLVALLLTNRASFRLDQGKREGVEADLKEALSLLRQAPGQRAFLRFAWRELARYYRMSERPADAAQAALERRKLSARLPGELYQTACDLAACVPLTKDSNEQNRYEEWAMETLRQARAAGFANLSLLNSDPALAPLRRRPDFRALLQEVRSVNKDGPR